jgi:hypothetical protein
LRLVTLPLSALAAGSVPRFRRRIALDVLLALGLYFRSRDFFLATKDPP